MRYASFLGGLACMCVLLVGCASTSKTQPTPPAPTPPAPIAVSIGPTAANVSVGKTQQFTATTSGTTNTGVTWSVVGAASNGTISTGGLYTGPAAVPNPPQVTVTATSQADTSKSASAVVTVTTVSPSTSVTVMPSAATVTNFGTQQFTASVNGSPSTAVTWQVNGMAGGNLTSGFVSTSGLYVAPSGVPTKSDGKGGSVTTTVTITAVSQADISASGTATVTIQPGNENAQSGAIVLGTSGGNANDSSTNTSTHTITCCGGTLGSLVTRGGTQYILSNTHILARSDLAQLGESIVQPALIDTSTCTSSGARTVANLSAFYNLENGTLPKIDAAIAQVVPGNVDPSGNILYLGASADANGVPVPGALHAGSGVVASVGMPLAKSGRSTGLTCSTALAVAVNVNVQYQKGCGTGATFSVDYTNQVDIAGGSFSAEGDSGSLIVSQNSADPVALLYAGSDTDTVGNPVAPVLNFFANGGNNVTFVGGGAHAVIGCSLPNKPAAARSTQAAVTVAPQVMQKAAAVRDAHAPELLAHPEVQAVGVGTSRDDPREPAILFFVTAGQTRTNIPAQVDGVRTRIVEGPLFARRGALSSEESAQLEQSVAEAPDVYPISEAALAQAKQVHEASAQEQMNQPGVQGVGISASLDAPGEAALMIFLVRGEAHNPIPPVIDGLRTRVRESSRFRAGSGDVSSRRACTMPSSKTLLRKPAANN
jgi:hypothetical protein